MKKESVEKHDMNDMNNVLVSIIIPVYNYEKYVGKCLQSVIEQSYKNIEIIVVDDGSTDGSLDVINMYAKSDDRIRVFHKTNGGIGSAYKLAFENVKGKYILFVDSDDTIALTTCEDLLKIAEIHNADIVEYGSEIFDIQGNKRGEKRLDDVVIIGEDEVLKDYLLVDRFSPLLKFSKVELFSNLVNLEYSVGIDEIISIQILSRCKKLVKTSKCLYRILGEPSKDSVSRRALNGEKIQVQVNMHKDILMFIESNVPQFYRHYQIIYLRFLIWALLASERYNIREKKKIQCLLVKEYRAIWKEVKKSEEYKELLTIEKIKFTGIGLFPKISARFLKKAINIE